MQIRVHTSYMLTFLLLEGEKHDAGILRESQLLCYLERHAFSTAGNPMCLYGDPAYISFKGASTRSI